jgi:hypothetical protein
MRKVINQREKQPNPAILQGFKDLLKISVPLVSWLILRSEQG